METSVKTLTVKLPSESYDVHIGRGLLRNAEKYLALDRKVMILTDDGVPKAYAEAVAAKAKAPFIHTVKQGEESKSLASAEAVLSHMLREGFTRTDCLVAVGGGIVGDLGGFVASLYMRGIDFYNLPTTVLSQVDSSIGGKTAVNLSGIKNTVGTFYQPKCVLADLDTLATLPERQVSQGLAEAVKMSLTHDASLFALFEKGEHMAHMADIIYASLAIKKSVVEQDEKEAGLRRVLNFGHTVGHGIESLFGIDADKAEDSNTREKGFYHGECVALGMLPMCADALVPRVKAVLDSLGLPTSLSLSADAVIKAMRHDKKATARGVHAVLVEAPGSFVMQELSFADLKNRINATFG